MCGAGRRSPLLQLSSIAVAPARSRLVPWARAYSDAQPLLAVEKRAALFFVDRAAAECVDNSTRLPPSALAR